MATPQQFNVNYGGKIYDLTEFLRNHPGGINTLENYKGKSVFGAMEKYKHSSSAYHLLEDFMVKNDNVNSNSIGEISDSGRIIVNGDKGRNLEEIKLLEELENRLDWSKAILGQLDKVADHYQLWVHNAVYKPCKLFSNPWLERLTFTPWYFAPMVWVPIICYMTWIQASMYVAGFREGTSPTKMPLTQFLWHICCGVVIWTLVEYSLHRWVFHLDPGTSLRGIQLHFLLHGVHHKVPFDSSRLVFPPIPAAVLAYFLYLPFSFLLCYTEIKMIGGLTGFLIYDMIHYYIHHGSPRDGSYLYMMKRYHSNHHFVNHDKAFGISSKVWDHIFQTRVQLRKLNFSLRWH